MRILGISGSLRRDSYNTKLLREAGRLLPPGAELVEFDGLKAVAPYDADDEASPVPPRGVFELRAAIAEADAILIATPEYNHSIPGVLKNAIDWASRPPDQPFRGKPVAMAGASMGGFGTARAQYHLRQTCVYLDMLPLNKPEVFVSAAHQKVDAEGRLTDEPSRTALRALLEALSVWTRRLRSS